MNLLKSLDVAVKDNKNIDSGFYELAAEILSNETLSVSALDVMAKVLGYKLWEFIKLGCSD